MVSPLGLIQEHELVRGDPWRVLVVCILCNRSYGARVIAVLPALFRIFPTADDLADADDQALKDLVDMLRPLGLGSMRVRRLVAMSRGWVDGVHENPGATVMDIEGVGQYGYDAYMLFVEGSVALTPKDKELRQYLSWRLTGMVD